MRNIVIGVKELQEALTERAMELETAKLQIRGVMAALETSEQLNEELAAKYDAMVAKYEPKAKTAKEDKE